jgi:mono/diheme cytochrome c family protein
MMLMLTGVGAAVAGALILALAGTPAGAQAPRAASEPGANKPGEVAPPNYFPRAAGDPAAIARGSQLYSANCAFCHGSDAHGGEVGPNLLRSPTVLNDQRGEVIATVVQSGRLERGMPKFDMTMEQVADIAAFIHSISIVSSESAFDRQRALVGNAAAGRVYFNGKGGCKSCHSASGDLAGVGRRLDPTALQDSLVTGGSTGMLGTPLPKARPRTARVTLSTGTVIEGTIESIDDFAVTIKDAMGKRRTFRRDGDVPSVVIHDPYEAHVELLKSGRDDDIHNLTAYLATLK